MKVTGPFRDASKKSSPWYLIVKKTKLNLDGSIVLNEKGRTETSRTRPFFQTKALAAAALAKMLAEHRVTGEGDFLWTRGASEEYTRAKAIAPEVTLDVVANFYRLHHPLTEKTKIGPLVEKFLSEWGAGNASKRHLSDLKSRLGRFVEKFGERYPDTFNRDEIIDFVCQTSKVPRTRKNYKTAVVNFFNWMVEEKLVSSNPAAGIPQRKLGAIPRNEIVFLKLDKVEHYLRTIERYDPELVAHEIIQLIAGVRADDEMANFKAKDVMPQTKSVNVLEGKTGADTINMLEPNFWKWWEVYGPKEGLVRPPNYGPRWDRVRVLAQIQSRAVADELAALPIKPMLKRPEAKKALVKWPWNARRRTFCTYHVAMHQSADRTALILRHHGSVATLHNSYRGKGVTEEEGIKYFQILPDVVKNPIRPIPISKGIVKSQMPKRSSPRKQTPR